MAIVTLEEMAAHLNREDRSDDPELQTYVDAVDAIVERHLGQVVAPRTVADEEHEVSCWGGTIILRHTPVISLTSVVAADGSRTWDTALVRLNKATGALHGGVGPALSGTVWVTYQAGMSSIPANVKLATQIIVAHLWETQRMSALSPSSAADPGLMPTGFGFAIPNRAAELLGGTPPVIA